MNQFHLKIDWREEDSQQIQGAELQATWAYLEIIVNEITITQLYDNFNQEVRNGLYLPLYPFAEWLAINWWSLGYECQTTRRKTAFTYAKRHHLYFAREGYALPSLAIQPAGDQIYLEWQAVEAPWQRLKFLQTGIVGLDLEIVRDGLAKFIEAVIWRLEEKNIFQTFLAEEWETIKASQSNSDEYDFCVAAAQLGLNPYRLSSSEETSILEASEQIPAELLKDFYLASEIGELSAHINWVRQTLDTIHSTHGNKALSSLIELRKSIPEITPRRPWQEGYECARDLRKRLNVGSDIIISWQDFDRCFRQPEGTWKETITGKPHSTFDALMSITQNLAPGLVVTKPREDSQKFALGRALFEYLYAKQDTSLISVARSESQKRNRAFAAEFLLPCETLRQHLPGNMVSDQDLDELASNWVISSHVIRHQIENHHLAQIIF